MLVQARGWLEDSSLLQAVLRSCDLQDIDQGDCVGLEQCPLVYLTYWIYVSMI